MSQPESNNPNPDEANAPKAIPPGLPEITPDLMEQELGERMDNTVPSYGYEQLPMVGLGGSAGSIQALQSFFEAMPPQPGLVFVVVLHLAPDYASNLAEMIAKWTPMRVVPATDGAKVTPNTVYVIPPGKLLVSTNGHLKLTELDREHGRRVAVDLFFRSLADTHGPHAAAIVLSGADGDGALGIRRIKERGGLTIAQDPEEAEHGSMPRAAMASGTVDWVLRAEEMPKRILDYVASEKRLQLPPEDGPEPTAAPRPAPSEPEAALREILLFLRMRTGRDFSYYKRATILRRISRRMQVNSVEDMPAYLAFLRTHPGEAGALLKDLLISVTNFFRDRDAFAALEARIPDLFAGKGQGDTVRVWVPACATGEEAYSIAILLIEHSRTVDAPPAIQVFGCDLDDDAIQAARAGVFPDAIAADVSEERLRRFFVKEHGGYRVRREVREVVLFAAHDLLKDPPFSRLDLISCRNLLIYLNRDAQARVFEIFHFALKPEGFLFLGSSESVEDGSFLFRVVNKKHRLYARKSAARIGLPVPGGPGTLLAQQIERHVHTERAVGPQPPPISPSSGYSQIASQALAGARAAISHNEERVSWSDLHFKLIERFGPPSVLVNADYDIQHLSENAGRFLQIVGGQPTTNLLRLVNPALRIELRAALFRASQMGQATEVLRVPAELQGVRREVDIHVSPARDLASDYLLVTFEARELASAAPRVGEEVASAQPESIVQHLERELEQMKGHLRDTVEQYEASTEELKASNEELQAMNEELRSATEELETSREELQSINEELTTVNQELKNKVDELGHANSDLQNLMSATAIATVFLDRAMRIMRFTDSAAPIFNLIPSDIGRPLSDLQHRIDYPELGKDAERVLEKLAPVEREVSGAGEACYLARMLPYRTVDDRIAGVVLTFVDITDRQQAERAMAQDLQDTERLRKVSDRLITEGNMQELFDEIIEAAVAIMHADAGMVSLFEPTRREFRLLASQGFSKSASEPFAQMEFDVSGPYGATIAQNKRAFLDFGAQGSEMSELEQKHVAKGLKSIQVTPLITRSGRTIGVLSTHWRKVHRPSERELRFLDLLARQAVDAIERKLSEDALRDRMEELTRFNKVAVGRESRMMELKREVNDLCARLNQGPRYSLDFDSDKDSQAAS